MLKLTVLSLTDYPSCSEAQKRGTVRGKIFYKGCRKLSKQYESDCMLNKNNDYVSDVFEVIKKNEIEEYGRQGYDHTKHEINVEELQKIVRALLDGKALAYFIGEYTMSIELKHMKED